MKKILFSSGLIVFVAAVTLSATGAFFSDTETSTGNTFTAGDIDLKIDNESYITATTTIPEIEQVAGQLIASPWTSWALADLEEGTHKFFDFIDLKPGDIGEDTISIHVGSNDAWMCAAARLTDNSDQTCTESEIEDGDPNCVPEDNGFSGDLAQALNFAFWVDDGDNVLETDEYNGGAGIFLQGPLSGLDLQGKITLADSASSILGDNIPIPGDTTFYIAKAWCFGTLTPTPEDEGEDLSPLNGTGFTCAGADVNNAAQTDRVQGDMEFYAVQSRNNPTFTCDEGYTPFRGIDN